MQSVSLECQNGYPPELCQSRSLSANRIDKDYFPKGVHGGFKGSLNRSKSPFWKEKNFAKENEEQSIVWPGGKDSHS